MAASRSRLREWRIQRGYSLAEVAGLAGLSVSMLSRVERGERVLAPHTRVLVCRRLDAALSDLFEPTPLIDEAS